MSQTVLCAAAILDATKNRTNIDRKGLIKNFNTQCFE
jgi:hypothetical protein